MSQALKDSNGYAWPLSDHSLLRTQAYIDGDGATGIHADSIALTARDTSTISPSS